MSSDEIVVIDRPKRSLIFFSGVVKPARMHRVRLLAIVGPFIFAAIASLTFVLAVADRWRPFALSLMFIALGVNILVLMIAGANRRVAWDGVRIRAGGELVLVGKGFGSAYLLVAGMCYMASAALTLWSQATPGIAVLESSRGVIGAVAVLLLGIVCVVAAAIGILRRSYVRIAQDGITMRQGILEHRILWSDVASVSLRASGTQNATLELERKDGSSFSLFAIYLGSNPRFAAELLAFFLRNPSKRVLLRDPVVALNEVFVINGS